jgi:hypothetical protein
LNVTASLRQARYALKLQDKRKGNESPTDQLAFLIVLSPADLATPKTPIENVNRCSTSSTDSRVIRHPYDNGR